MIIEKLAHRLRRGAVQRPGALILMYHRVAVPARDPQLLCVHPELFAEQIEILRRHWRPISLAALISEMAGGHVRPRTVCVTFDDGYSDNADIAAPILRASDVAATVYITTGAMLTSRPFMWVDELDELLFGKTNLPDEIELKIGGKSETVHCGPNGENDGWNVLLPYASPRQQAYRYLHDRLRQQPPDERKAVLAQLSRAAGSVPEPSASIMNDAQVTAMTTDGLIEIGSHTVGHPVLASLPSEEQRREIICSKQRLEECSGKRIDSFAYPYGGRSDYNAQTQSILRDLGFRSACSTAAGQVRSDADPLQLPRFCVRNWNGEQFARQLSDWTVSAQ